MSFLRIIAGMAAITAASCSGSHAPLRIAAAADLRYALDDLVKTYRDTHVSARIDPTYGSSGVFYAQLVSQAPFDLFLSADIAYPRRLAGQGLTLAGSEFTYANGRIVLWTRARTGVDLDRLGIQALRAPAVRHIAIANPAHAPYGRAAEAALRSLGIYEAVRDKLVMGENIAQAFEMAQSGGAEVGIVALSLAMAPGSAAQGHYWEVPRGAYPPIVQAGAIMRWTKNPEVAQAFRQFLLAPEGRAILRRYGFSTD